LHRWLRVRRRRRRLIIRPSRRLHGATHSKSHSVVLLLVRIARAMSLVKFEATLLEVAKAHLRDAFSIAQPTLTCALKCIFVKKFGAADWLAQFKTYLGRSMQEHAVDDGRAFDM
jgi:hypothetical protein